MNHGPTPTLAHESPAVMRRQLRMALRQTREDLVLTQKQVAAQLYWSVSKIIRIEQGLVPVTPTDVTALLSLYGVTDQQQIDHLISLALGSKKQPWDEYKNVYSPAALTLFGNEAAAKYIFKYEPTYVPGLLQIPDYAEALLKGLGNSAHEIEQKVSARVARQELLRAEPRPALTYIIGEGAVSTTIGSPEIMLRQFERIKELGARPGIDIHILPFSAGPHPRMADAFTILEFGDDLEDLLYLENAGRETTTRDDQEQIAEYRNDFVKLEGMSSDSADLDRVLDEIASARFRGHRNSGRAASDSPEHET
jgi:transcriptional regulator with XRE-family HTH domain